MRGDSFLDKMELIEAEYVAAAETASKRKKHIWIRLGALAACICILATAAFVFPDLLPEVGYTPPETSQPPVTEPSVSTAPPETSEPETEPPAVPELKTSESYSNLSELLSALSGKESHGEGIDGNRMDATAARGTGSSEHTEYSRMAKDPTGEYIYYTQSGLLHIFREDEGSLVTVKTLDIPAFGMFVWDSNLVILSHIRYSGEGLNATYRLRIGIYDITIPTEPVLEDEFFQMGTLTACWKTEDRLYLITGDGMCACGWSRLEDTSGYYPMLWHGDTELEWTEEETSVLGTPTRVQYSAVTVIDTENWQVLNKKAIYGDILELFYGGDWVAAAVAVKANSLADNSDLYTFDRDLTFTGKIDAARIADPEKKGQLTEINAVACHDGIFRLLGRSSSTVFAIAADPQTGEASVEQQPYSPFSEILWEGNRAILLAGRGVSRFLLAEFDGLNVSLRDTGLQAAYLDGSVGYSVGKPLGSFETMIPMGNGIYVRYSLPAEGPRAFDIFDFSDSENPKRLYRATESLCDSNAFDFYWHVYDENTFGTMKVIPKPEGYRRAQLTWCKYTVDPSSDTPIKLVSEIPLEGIYSFTPLEAGDWLYYTTKLDLGEPYQLPLPLE